MPAKRKAPSGASAGASKPAPKKRQSKLAKENNITAEEEAEIKEAFSLFSEPMEGEKEGVIPIDDVRRAMIALDIPPKDAAEQAEFVSILDPDDEGFAQYPSFVAICALKMHARHRTSDAHVRQVDDAFALFTTTRRNDNDDSNLSLLGNGDSVITMAHLRRVASMLNDDEVDDDLLRDMILEANGGAGVGRGVNRHEFEAVMRRAGVWR
ncbi:hypothetical protein MCOR27_004767 [Pyricularia oryzae]|uniref:Calmodulin n=3 Tax=Pyricularia TaxID=48558 RepID=A0ABQ8NWD4_PYRGI|nr:hypothetical protein OOU_Y34scaffold00094g72 [Pyricularia oryzae Y34]KAH8839521.1 hypothetical protein MCOR01_008717 [Pyricularia oryzae]KAI6303102.1 hypothetical protein MCOR33_001699 [Pyricularia grisea]KAH9439377.1 hypothetical protein MCOR02_002936 [Pyricularia oryzae]KAI6255958.1 hypothetical protein MCOR19_007585 [Pyricularia oryzae]